MTYAELLASALALAVFCPSLASAVPPLAALWRGAERAHRYAGNLEFLARGFRLACAGGNLEGWRFAVSAVDGLLIESIAESRAPDGSVVFELRGNLDGTEFEVLAEGGLP